MNRHQRRAAEAQGNPDKTKLAQVGRLAFREEGAMWNAYYAPPGTMKGAIPLGSMAMTLVANEERKQAFMDLMRDCVGDLIKEATGITPTWGGPQSAPESERAGHS